MKITLTADQLAESVYGRMRLTPDQIETGLTLGDLIAERTRLFRIASSERMLESAFADLMSGRPTDDSAISEEDEMSTGITIDPTAPARAPGDIDRQFMRDAAKALQALTANEGHEWRQEYIAQRIAQHGPFLVVE